MFLLFAMLLLTSCQLYSSALASCKSVVSNRSANNYRLSMMSETGWQLSQGERSRLSIARTLLQGADCLILDESFATLDPETLHQALQCVLERAPTLLVIAHP